MPPQSGARLRIRRRALPLQTILPAIRTLIVISLVGAAALGGFQWLASPRDVDALEFSQVIIAKKGSALSVRGMAAADLNGDGKQDAITVGSDGVKVYQNLGSNKFTKHVVDSFQGERVQAVDLNKDGKLDLLVASKDASSGVVWYENNGDFSFTSHTLGTTGKDTVAYAGDLDADGWPDIATAQTIGDKVVLSRWMNNDGDTFTETVLSADSKVTALTAGKVDGGGYQDIVTTGVNGLQRWRTTDGSSWASVDVDDQNKNLTHVALGYPDDTRVFIVTGDTTKGAVAIYRSNGDGKFQRLILTGAANAKTVVPVDFNGDGLMDVVVAGQDDNAVYWYENTGDDEWTQHTLASGLQSVYGVAVADFTGDKSMDFITGDMMQGAVYLYTRTHPKPEATAPDSITQSTLGTGVISFKTTVTDADLNTTKLRLEYSIDGKTWNKPWLTSAKVNSGSVDLKNSNEYQIGSSNAIDTTGSNGVTLTVNWDTKSTLNIGGPLIGDHTKVQLRVKPKDTYSIGSVATSAKFEVDNQAPVGLRGLTASDIANKEVTLKWTAPTDSNDITYRVYYGTNSTDVLDEKSAVWDSTKDDGLGDGGTTSTKITGLMPSHEYTFKIVAKDAFGNAVTAPSVRVTTSATSSATPTPSSIFSSPTPTPTASVGFSPSPSPSVSVSPTPEITSTPIIFSPTPTPTSNRPSVLLNNKAPIADAGEDQVVNPSTLVILSGSGSSDPEGEPLAYSWRQLEGPHIDISSARTDQPSFSAQGGNQTYIFELTVQDPEGATGISDVTIATKNLLPGLQASVSVAPTVAPVPGLSTKKPTLVQSILAFIDQLLLGLSIFSTSLLLVERVMRRLQEGKGGTATASVSSVSERAKPQGRVIHHQTGRPIANAQVMVYGQDGKLRATERTNAQGVFGTFFPIGEYTLGVQADGFTFAPAGVGVVVPEGTLLYTGGKLTVKDANQPLSLLIPLKPMGTELSSARVKILHFWQTVQYVGRAMSWPLILIGALYNTVLVFIAVQLLFLLIEVVYIILVVVKIALEVRVRPAYGQVRDAITHIPLDLATVRLFEQGTNRLVMTRVTNNQGKFFALPPAGKYMVTITKPGYAAFSKYNVELKSEHDTTLQMIADLMPVAPTAIGLQHARAAII